MEKLTPKEKAKDLMIKMLGFEPKDFDDIHLELDIIRDIYEAKLNSLVCVNEILVGMSNQINQVDSLDIIYWQKVEQALKDNFN